MLIFLVASILLPATAPVSIAPSGKTACWVSLDVCNAKGSFLSAQADTPLLLECVCSPSPLELAELFEDGTSSFVAYLFPIQIERPPRI